MSKVEVFECSYGNDGDSLKVKYEGRRKGALMTVIDSGKLALFRLSAKDAQTLGQSLLDMYGSRVDTKPTPKGPQQYRGAENHTWETILSADDVSYTERVKRLRVPGGWLYQTGDCSPTFVPMPDVVGYSI